MYGQIPIFRPSLVLLLKTSIGTFVLTGDHFVQKMVSCKRAIAMEKDRFYDIGLAVKIMTREVLNLDDLDSRI